MTAGIEIDILKMHTRFAVAALLVVVVAAAAAFILLMLVSLLKSMCLLGMSDYCITCNEGERERGRGERERERNSDLCR